MSVFRRSYPTKKVPLLTNQVDLNAPSGFVSSQIFGSINQLTTVIDPSSVTGQRALYRDGSSVLVARATGNTWFPEGSGGRNVEAVWFQEADNSLSAVVGFFLASSGKLIDGDIGVGLNTGGSTYQKYFYKYSSSLQTVSFNGFHKASFRDTNTGNIYVNSELSEADITGFNNGTILTSQGWTADASGGVNTTFTLSNGLQTFNCADSGGRIVAYNGSTSYSKSDLSADNKRIFLRIEDLNITVSDSSPSVSNVAFVGFTVSGVNPDPAETNLFGIIYDDSTGDWVFSDDSRTVVLSKTDSADVIEMSLYETTSNRIFVEIYIDGSLAPDQNFEINISNGLIEPSGISLPVVTDSKGIIYNQCPADLGFTESVLELSSFASFILES